MNDHDIHTKPLPRSIRPIVHPKPPVNLDELELALAHERDPLLVEREKSHGSFKDNATTWRKLCLAYDETKLNPSQALAVSMIFLKLARAMQHSQVKDHWDDVAGYAKLAAEACE